MLLSDIYEFNGAVGSGWSQPPPMFEGAEETIPISLRRSKLPEWPRASEPELVRHYTWLSQRNFGIDTGFYPLGSCTMKHNPRVNERIVNLAGIDRIHHYSRSIRSKVCLLSSLRCKRCLKYVLEWIK